MRFEELLGFEVVGELSVLVPLLLVLVDEPNDVHLFADVVELRLKERLQRVDYDAADRGETLLH